MFRRRSRRRGVGFLGVVVVTTVVVNGDADRMWLLREFSGIAF